MVVYKRVALVDAKGLPWVVEMALAATAKEGGMFHAMNYSAAFGDPLKGVHLVAGDAKGIVLAEGRGIDGFMSDMDRWTNCAAVVHVITPVARLTDKGKGGLIVPPEVASAIAIGLLSVSKTMRAEVKRWERARASNQPVSQEDQTSLITAVFAVMDEAIAKTSGNGAYPFGTRNLYYVVRRLIQSYTDVPLIDHYFSQKLVVRWEEEHGKIAGHYREPRGELHEPHTGEVVRLGTREVDGYVLPEYVYNKILYVEKEGFEPIFERARLGERFDLAVAYGKGMPVEAVRKLFERAEAGDFKLFVLHDADPSGYGIARTMREATVRMPRYSVDVVDIGLSVADAIELDLETEEFTRKGQLPTWMREPDVLDDQETEWFVGDQPDQTYVQNKKWRGTRCELNALTAPQLVDFIERKLVEDGATDKIVPPVDVLADRRAAQRRRSAVQSVQDYLARRFDTDALASALLDRLPDDDVDLTAVVTDAHTADRAVWWRTAIDDEVYEEFDQQLSLINAALDELLNT